MGKPLRDGQVSYNSLKPEQVCGTKEKKDQHTSFILRLKRRLNNYRN